MLKIIATALIVLATLAACTVRDECTAYLEGTHTAYGYGAEGKVQICKVD